MRVSLLIKMMGLVVALKGLTIFCADGVRLIEMVRWGALNIPDRSSTADDGTVFSKFDWAWQSQHSLYWRAEWLVEGAAMIAIGGWMWRDSGRRFLTRKLLGGTRPQGTGVET